MVWSWCHIALILAFCVFVLAFSYLVVTGSGRPLRIQVVQKVDYRGPCAVYHVGCALRELRNQGLREEQGSYLLFPVSSRPHRMQAELLAEKWNSCDRVQSPTSRCAFRKLGRQRIGVG